MMNKSDFIEKIIEYSNENSGGTFDFDHYSVCEYERGYFVANGNCGIQVSELSFLEVYNYVHSFKLDDFGGKLLGIWNHDGWWYLDVTEWVLWEDIAKHRGNLNGQYSIWDCANNKEILLND